MLLRNNIQRLLVLSLALLLALPKAQANDLDVKELVFEHLGDSYTWHIAEWNGRELAIPLPIIVRSKAGEWSAFSSSRLQHHATYNGFSIAEEGKYKGKIVETGADDELVRPSVDISLTKNALALLISCGVLLLIILPVARWYKNGTMQPAKGFRGAVEMLIISVYDDIIKPCVGEDYKKYAPYLLTAFFFIFVNNLIGLVPFFPGGANVTGNIAITLFLAVCTFLAVNLFGTKAYWKEILWPDVPTWLKVPAPIMPVIELFGIFTKPFALMIRLFANIMAGHAVALGLISIIFITASMGAAINAGMSAIAIVFACFMTLVECLVAYIQAYVFTLLSSVFIGMARVKHHEKIES